MRILVTGSREWQDYATFTRALTVAIETLTERFPDDKHIVVVHGGARGADSMSENYVAHVRAFLRGQGYNIDTEVHKADWNQYGKGAGPIRNQKMVDLGADIAVAFLQEGSRGTADCIRRINAAGIELLTYKDY